MRLVKSYIVIFSIIFISESVFSQGTNTPSCSGGIPNATLLTPSTTCTYVAGTTVGATYQQNAANAGTPSCATPGAPDVFFMFTAPASGNVTIDLGAGTMTNSGMELYSGSCGAWVSVSCDNNSGTGNMSQITAAGLTPGQTYLIRVWNVGGSGTGTFTICVQDNGAGGGVSNDDPCTATPVTAGATCTYSSYTNAGATDSGLADPGCANFNGGDVWFSVTVPASGNLVFDTDDGAMTDGGMAIYSGTCGSLTLLSCNDDGSTNGLMPMISQPGLTPGSTIWIQMWEYGNDNPGTFGLCVYDGGSTAGAPANDDPCNATVVSVGTNCNFSTYTNANATATGGVPAPGCASYSGGDVWFQVTVPASGALTFDSNTGVMLDGGMAIYSGTCGSLTLIACNDDGSVNGAMPMLASTTLTPGATIWIRMWEYGNNNNGTFQLCVWEQTPPPPPPGNVSCAGMQPICSDTPITFTASTSDDDADVTNPGNDYGCLFTSPNPTWYYLQIQQAGVISINMSAGSDIDFALWGPFTNLANAQAQCNGYTAPIDCSYSIAATEQANYASATVGQVFVLLVTNYADVTQVIDLNSAAGNTALTDCSIVLPIELIEFYAVAEYSANSLYWNTASEHGNELFYIERSYDGSNFFTVGTINGTGNSSTHTDYQYSDRDYSENLTYYRLKQTDMDGNFTYSSIVSVNRETDQVKIYPNPTSGTITIDFPSGRSGNYQIKVTDPTGRVYSEKIEISDEIASYSSSILEKLNSGIYFIEISDEAGNVISVDKILKSSN